MAKKRQKQYHSGAKYRTTGPAGHRGAITPVGKIKIKGETYLIVKPRKRRTSN